LSIWLSFAFLRNVLESFHDVLCTTKHYEMKLCEMACSQGLQLLFDGLGKGQIGFFSQAHHCLTAQSYKIFCLNQFYLLQTIWLSLSFQLKVQLRATENPF
jgi:hypothetical protein